MTYSNKFVVCVLVDGRPVEELANGEVRIPFGEYSLRFRNKHDRRAVVKIFIDGENVSGGGYIINSHSSLDVKRHHDVDRAFKFVSLDSPDAIEHGKNGPNHDKVKGTIEARFYLEREVVREVFLPVVHHHHHHHEHDQPWKYPQPVYPPVYPPKWMPCCRNGDVVDKSLSTGENQDLYYGMSSDASPSVTCSTGNVQRSINRARVQSAPIHDLQDGCTVEGKATGQRFYSTSIELDEEYTSLKIFLRGYEPEVQEVSTPSEPTRRTNKDRRIDDLEEENEKLRRQLAELENARLKEKLQELKEKLQ